MAIFFIAVKARDIAFAIRYDAVFELVLTHGCMKKVNTPPYFFFLFMKIKMGFEVLAKLRNTAISRRWVNKKKNNLRYNGLGLKYIFKITLDWKLKSNRLDKNI